MILSIWFPVAVKRHCILSWFRVAIANDSLRSVAMITELTRNRFSNFCRIGCVEVVMSLEVSVQWDRTIVRRLSSDKQASNAFRNIAKFASPTRDYLTNLIPVSGVKMISNTTVPITEQRGESELALSIVAS